MPIKQFKKARFQKKKSICKFFVWVWVNRLWSYLQVCENKIAISEWSPRPLMAWNCLTFLYTFFISFTIKWQYYNTLCYHFQIVLDLVKFQVWFFGINWHYAHTFVYIKHIYMHLNFQLVSSFHKTMRNSR